MDTSPSKQGCAAMMASQGVEPVEQHREGRSGQEGQGPFYVMNLRLAEGRIASATFRTVGCPWSVKIGSALVKLVEGKTPRQACYVTEEDVEREMGGVPRDRIHYLPLAIQALRSAL
jgi:NifU-like protein involved in Fe-S cluster formation